MPSSKKPRKAYKPRKWLRNPMHILEGFGPLTNDPDYILKIKMANHSAMTELLAGRATCAQINSLVAMCNMVEGLTLLGHAKDYIDVHKEGKDAIINIARRAGKIGRYVPTGPEIVAINDYMELHDQLMEVVTVNDVDRARELALKLHAEGKVEVIPRLKEKREQPT